jgi:S1-C subfamily serine protease
MAFGSGIPKRAFRLNKKEYAVILNSHDVEKDIADYLLYPSPVSLPESPKLGVFLKEEGVMVSISELVPGGIAEQAGLKIGDVILSLDDDKVESLEDMKIHLLFRKKGDTVAVKVKRARFLFGDKEMEFKVVL